MRAGALFDQARDRHVAGLGERDRRLAHALAAGVLRRQQTLDQALDLARADPRLHDILRLGAYQLRALERVPTYAAVSTSVDLARELAGEPAAKFVNQALRRFANAGKGKGVGGRVTTHPAWLLARWTARFGGAGAARLAAWNDTKPPVTLQLARWSLETLRARLLAAGIGVTEAPFGAGLQITGRRPTGLPGFTEGGFLVQDAAQALVCRFAAIPAGSLVYDACAAPGGKAVTLEATSERLRVIAGDARRSRLPHLVGTVWRCGVAIRVVAADLLSAPFAPGLLDAVFVDAPCTATGTMARHPDARWRLTERAIARAALRQRELLAAAASLVRPGGLLVYATCSLEPEETVAVVEEFLSRHPEFTRAPAGAVPDALITPAGDFESLPQRDGIDGAYAARLTRRR